jgi:hypothetical protein
LLATVNGRPQQAVAEEEMKVLLPILKPDLDDAHIEAGVLRELFPDVPRWLRTTIVSTFESF